MYVHFIICLSLVNGGDRVETDSHLIHPEREVVSVTLQHRKMIVRLIYSVIDWHFSILHLSVGQELVNHCFADMERFMARLQMTAEARSILHQPNRKKSRKKSTKAKKELDGKRDSPRDFTSLTNIFKLKLNN